jgi:hypothetical protein
MKEWEAGSTNKVKSRMLAAEFVAIVGYFDLFTVRLAFGISAPKHF